MVLLLHEFSLMGQPLFVQGRDQDQRVFDITLDPGPWAAGPCPALRFFRPSNLQHIRRHASPRLRKAY